MRNSKKLLSFILSCIMVISMLPTLVFGANGNKVRVIVENNTYAVSEGAPWEGVLLDEWVEIDNKSSIMSSVVKALDEKGYSQTGATSGYITEINGISEMDNGNSSGWMGNINDWFADEGLSAFTVSSGKLSGGDEIRMQYTADWGADIGSVWGDDTTTLKSIYFSEGELSPAFSSDIKEYKLILPSSVKKTIVTPAAVNKNYQVRLYKNSYKPANAAEYKRNEEVAVSKGDKLFVGVGNSTWPTMNDEAEETVYVISVEYENTATVRFSAQQEGAFFDAPGKEFTVPDGIAEEYGYTMPANDHNGIKIESPTVFDLLVYIHKEMYSDDFTSATAKNYLNFSTGSINRAYGISSSDISFFVNHDSLNDGIETSLGTTGYNATEARLCDNDVVDFFFYFEDGYWCDYYTFFSESEKIVVEDTDFTLNLKGFMAMSAMGYTPVVGNIIGGEDGYITLNTVKANGDLSPALKDSDGDEYLIDEDGMVTMSFDEPGEYIITANGFEGEYGMFPILAPYLKLTVVKESDVKPYFTQINFLATALNGWTTTTFSPKNLSYNLDIRLYTTSTLSFQSTTEYDADKYTAVATYVDVNGITQNTNVSNKAVTMLPNMPFGKTKVVVKITDKTDENNFTDYIFNVTRPYDVGAQVRATTGIVITPENRAISATKLDNYAEGTMFKLNASGDRDGTGVATTTYKYETFLYSDVEKFSLALTGSTNYVHFRTKLDDGEWTEIKEVNTPFYEIGSDGIANVTIQAVSDYEYVRNGFAFVASKGNEYTVRVLSEDALIDDATLTDVKVAHGDFYPEFASDMFAYTVVIDSTDEMPDVSFKLPANCTVKRGTTDMIANADGVYSFVLTTANQTINVTNVNGVANAYTFNATKKVNAVPDRVVDYLCINGQYTNASYGIKPETILAGSMKSTGNFGGYVTFYYEDAIKNDSKNPYGVDFYVYGNSFVSGGTVYGSAEPGQVWVSEDNKNWYALAASEHYEDTTLKDYKITYTKTATGRTAWRDNYGNSNDGVSNAGTWPLVSNYYMNDLAKSNSITLDGILLPASDGKIYGSGNVGTASFGYVDYFPNGTIGANVNPYTSTPSSGSSGFDLAWAVDKDGNTVKFKDGIHYVKVVTASNIWASGINEKSPEVARVIRTTAEADEVGKTTAPAGITVKNSGNTVSDLVFEEDVFEYNVNAKDFKDISLAIDDADSDDNIYVNNTKIAYDETADITFDGNSKTVRLIVQNGEKEPLVYILNVIDGKTSEVNDVIDLIKTIGTVTIDSEGEIDSARSAYDSLTTAQKKQVTNYATLVVAEEMLGKIKQDLSDKELAEWVDELIDAIGEVGIGSQKDIEKARVAYNLLNDAQKALVENYDVLLKAEQDFDSAFKAKAKLIEEAYDKTGSYLLKGSVPTISSVGGEWVMLGLARADRMTDEFRSGYYTNVVNALRENNSEQLSSTKSTENARVSLALRSLGFDISNIDGRDVLKPLNDIEYVKNQGINGPIWALIAFNSLKGVRTELNTSSYITYIISTQMPDGGWAIDKVSSDADTTAMALQALAPYYEENISVKQSVDKALSLLPTMSYSSSESYAQAIVALTSLGINPDTDEKNFVNGKSLIDNLLDYYVTGGGFKHDMIGEINQMATEQAYYALVSYFRFIEGKTSFYDMSDVSVETNPVMPKPDDETISPTPSAPAKITGLKVKNKKKRTAAITWKKAKKNALGYKIEMSKKSKKKGFKVIKTIRNVKTLKFNKKNLKKGKTYYFRVRAYNRANGKVVYGKYSKVMKVKIKK